MFELKFVSISWKSLADFVHSFFVLFASELEGVVFGLGHGRFWRPGK